MLTLGVAFMVMMIIGIGMLWWVIELHHRDKEDQWAHNERQDNPFPWHNPTRWFK